MRKIVCVCFPRSGHHLLTNILFKYFSKNAEFLEFSGESSSKRCSEVINAGNLFYCEYYNHCRSFPCTDKNTNFQKNHDYDLLLNIQKGYYYIVLYRNPIESIVSLYEHITSDPYKNKMFGHAIGYGKSDWEAFAKEAMVYWKNFIKKWIFPNSNNEFLFVKYEDIIETPLITINEIIKFIDPNNSVDFRILIDSIKKIKIDKKRNLKEFKFYDSSFFKSLEDMIYYELKSLEFM